MNESCLNIGDQAPAFTAATTFGPVSLSDYQGKWVILFSHPGDFTPVCTTEFIAFAKAQPQFEALNAQLLGLSIDSSASHLAWVYAIYAATGVQVPFPVIADRDGSIARLYGMIAPNASTQETVRNVFFIDPEQTVRAPQTGSRASLPWFLPPRPTRGSWSGRPSPILRAWSAGTGICVTGRCRRPRTSGKRPPPPAL